MKWFLSFFSLLLLMFFIPVVYSAEIRLNMPIVSDSPKQHHFYHELLTTAIKEIGHTPILTVRDIPQLRIKQYLDLGTISIYWMLETAERNQRYIPIKIGLTNGLIGNPLYDKIKTLADFRALGLVGGMGLSWFDAKVWQANNLKYKEFIGNWASIFKMLARGRNFDYFARGINEISLENSQYPALHIEKNLSFGIFGEMFIKEETMPLLIIIHLVCCLKIHALRHGLYLLEVLAIIANA